MKPIKVGVIGAGYLGKYHAEKYAQIPEAELVGVVDVNLSIAQEIAGRFKAQAFDNYMELFDRVDAVSIVVPTDLHHDIAKKCLEGGIDVLVEKPVTVTIQEADDLIGAAKSGKRILQVGHLERFNAAVLSLDGVINRPMFIETHRLAPFKDRGTEVDVILDIMIHDIDMIMYMVGAPVTAIHAVGIPVISPEKNDIANVRLEFQTGCVANLTASRISLKEMRKTRIFQHNAYISIDYAMQQAEVYRRTVSDNQQESPQIVYEQIDIQSGDSLKEEIKSFLNSVSTRKAPDVSGEAGRDALKVALEIVEQVESKKSALQM